MDRAKGIVFLVCLMGLVIPYRPATALDAYTPEQQSQFMDWCTGAKSASESACSCTLKRLAQTVAPAALASFINTQSGGGFSVSSTAITTAALVTDALVACNK